jgi:hypothetical protein
MSDQPSLFDPSSTVPAKCVCGTTRKNLCQYDYERSLLASNETASLPLWPTRPMTCLQRHDPYLANLPEDF